MKLGIIGLPQSGKTTIFNAVTRGNAPTTASAGRFEVHNSVVDVPDPRVTILSKMFNPKKTIYAKMTYADIAGLETGSAKSGISGQLLNQLAQLVGNAVDTVHSVVHEIDLSAALEFAQHHFADQLVVS